MSQAGFFGFGGSSGPIQTITGTSGGAVSPDGAGNINLLGMGGVSVVGDAPTNTLTIQVSGSGFNWNVVTGDTGITTDNGYITNSGSLITLTLPATAAVGTAFAVAGLGSGGWVIAQNAGQSIQIGVSGSTPGATGSVASTSQYDSVQLLCVVANTLWVSMSAPQGTLTVT